MTAFPCKGYFASLGAHLNQYFNIKESKTSKILDCNEEIFCSCGIGNRCKINANYGETSKYEGFIARDIFSFKKDPDKWEDAFKLNFGCVTKETNLLFTQ